MVLYKSLFCWEYTLGKKARITQIWTQSFTNWYTQHRSWENSISSRGVNSNIFSVYQSFWRAKLLREGGQLELHELISETCIARLVRRVVSWSNLNWCRTGIWPGEADILLMLYALRNFGRMDGRFKRQHEMWYGDFHFAHLRTMIFSGRILMHDA